MGPWDQGLGVRAEGKMSSPPGRWGVGTVPYGVWEGRLGLRRFRVERRVPYTATQLAPAELGLWVATGRADQPDFISFAPAALCLGLGLLWP